MAQDGTDVCERQPWLLALRIQTVAASDGAILSPGTTRVASVAPAAQARYLRVRLVELSRMLAVGASRRHFFLLWQLATAESSVTDALVGLSETSFSRQGQRLEGLA